MHLFIYALVWKKKKLHLNSYTNFIFEVINSDMRQIWHFDVNVAGWVGQERHFDNNFGKVRYVSDPLHRYTNLDKAETFHI